jgi:hypothetical protein
LNFTIPRGLDGTANLADETPQPLGTASVGSALKAARADHVHATPTIVYSSLTGIPTTFSPAAHTHSISDVTNLQTALDGKQASGNYVSLDQSGKISSSVLPSYVDDVIEYASLSAFPSTNDVGKIYTAIDTRKIYRWSGTGYIEISPSPGTTTDVPEGTNLYFTNARAAAAAPVQSVSGRTGTITVAQLGTSGTASSTTFLRGDGQWTEAGGFGADDAIDGGFYVGYVPANTITIVTQPTPQTASAGAATFSASATSTPGGTPAYQWERQESGASDFTAVSGATSATLSLTGLLTAFDDQDMFRVVVSAANAVSVTSNFVLLTVPASVITISSQPASTTASDGAASFSASATVAPTATPAYQWQRSGDAGVTWANISGATSATLSLSGLTVEADGNARFRVVVSATNAVSVNSAAATLTVLANNTITITSQPNNQTASSAAASFRVSAVSSPGGTPAYQWQRRDLIPADGQTWTQRTLPVSANWYGVAFGNGKFVAIAGKDGGSFPQTNVAATSADGSSWTQRTLPATASWAGLAYGNGVFVALVVNSTIAATSSDGVTWTQRTMPTTANWSRIVYGGGLFVATTNNSNISATSTDGITWTQRSLPSLPAYSTGYSVAYGNGLFVAVASGTSATSTDGISWTQRTLANYQWIAYGNGLFVAVGGSSAYATSTDGVTWSSGTMPSGVSEVSRIMYDNGTFVATQTGQYFATSNNGTSWTRRIFPVYMTLPSVAYGNNRFVAVAQNSSIAATSDPTYAAFANISGATSSTLALTGLVSTNDQDQYRVVVTANNAPPVTSDAATLTVSG